MAIFRKVHVSFWSDTFVESLNKEQKLFYIYLLTNTETKQCGIYEISKKKIGYDLSCSIDTVSKHLEYFIKKDKIMYDEHTNELALKNWGKYNASTSPKVLKCIESELKNVKNTVLIEYVKGIYTLSQEEQEEEQEQEEEKKTTKVDFDFDGYLNFINKTLGKKLRVICDKTRKEIPKRLKQGYTKKQIEWAILNVKNVQIHVDNNYFHCTPEFFSREKTLQQYGEPPKNTGSNTYQLID